MTHINAHLGYDQVSAFIDGELSPKETSEVEEHLANCHPCAIRILSATQLKAATRHVSERFVVPPEALSRLTAQLSPEASKKPAGVYTLRSWTWGALAASLILAVSLLGWHATRQSGSLAAELLDQHLAVLSGGSPPEVISSDRHTVKPWFQGKLPFSFNLPDALPAGTTLNGGDLTFLHGQPAALLRFNIGRHQASVFFTQRSRDESEPATSGIQSGFVIQYANTHDLRITAVSDVNPSDLARLMSVLVEAQSPR
ncbi:anti-sigma factor [Granulicella sp. S190]|uniref:anti-sigma factor family protein n=1 Tax=Granulicella sp. S190 TaxID=1747226 RepID=UPI00131C3FAC|nr:zf-HC2 domain-containing protein [Granulicella sp. S190]